MLKNIKEIKKERNYIMKNITNTSIIIRKVENNDAKQYIELINSVWRVAYKNILPEEVFIDREKAAENKIKNFGNKFYNDNEIICYVAECNGIIVGAMNGSIKSTYEHFVKDGFADLVALYINPKYQGKGIGTKLKNIFEEWARENGATKYIIGVLKKNNNARKVYESWGGKLDDWEEKFYKLGIGYDEVFYKYNL